MNAVERRLDDGLRPALARIADILIPGGEGMPAASDADVQGKWIDRALATLPELEPEFSRLLAEAATAEPEEALRRLRAEPGSFALLTLFVSGSYVMNPRVRRLLGYPGAAPAGNPAFPDESDYYLEGGLLDAVLARGPVYRLAEQERCR